MTRQKIEMTFSLMFFFFAIFLFITIMTSSFISNFDNLLLIMLKPGGFFITLSRILIFSGICLSIYMYLKNKTNKKFSLFGFAIFSTIFTFSMLSNINDNELDRMINIYNYKDTNIIIESIKNIIVDSLVFVYFILIPVISFFYKKRVYDSYFYQTYLREIAPSLNTSIMFLFGYSIESYSFSSLYSVIDFILNISFIALFLRIAFNLKDTISFYTIMNILLLIIGFIIFLLSSEVLSRGNLYYIGIFFYSIGLLHWYLNISLKMKI